MEKYNLIKVDDKQIVKTKAGDFVAGEITDAIADEIIRKHGKVYFLEGKNSTTFSKTKELSS